MSFPVLHFNQNIKKKSIVLISGLFALSLTVSSPVEVVALSLF